MTQATLATVPTGTVKTFGKDGIPYLVENPVEQLANGDWLINIRLLDSNETTQYKLSKIIQDPQAK